MSRELTGYIISIPATDLGIAFRNVSSAASVDSANCASLHDPDARAYLSFARSTSRIGSAIGQYLYSCFFKVPVWAACRLCHWLKIFPWTCTVQLPGICFCRDHFTLTLPLKQSERGSQVIPNCLYECQQLLICLPGCPCRIVVRVYLLLGLG